MAENNQNNIPEAKESSTMKKALPLIIGGVVIAGAAVTVGTTTTEKMTDTELSALAMETVNGYYTNEVTLDTIKSTIDDNLESLQEDDKTSLLETYVYGLQYKTKELGTIYETLATTIAGIEAENEEIDFVNLEGIELIEDSMVRGLGEEIQKYNMKFVESGTEELPTYTLTLDYDALEEAYGSYFGDFIKDVIALERLSQAETMYDEETGILDFETIGERYDMIAGFEDGDVTTADYYWEYDRYYAYSYLLGFGDSSMNNADGTAYNEASVTAMETYIAAHPDSTIAANMQKIVDSIKAEGFYGDVTYEVANEILNAEFEAYFAYLDTQYADEEAAATEGGAAVEPVLTDTTITE
jgi:hypothetical protein